MNGRVDDFGVFPPGCGGKEHIKATKNDTGPLPNKKVQYGVQHGHQHLHIPNLSFKCNDLCVYSQVYGCKEHNKTTLDITELLNHYEIEFMTFSCPLSSANAQTPLSIE